MNRLPAIYRAWLHCLLLALPALSLAGFLFSRRSVSLGQALLLSAGLLLYLYLVSASFIQGMVRSLQTLSNVVLSLREGDYTIRARLGTSPDAMGELAAEINTLADLLQRQRVRSLESTALLARILEVMHAPLFAFDHKGLLQLVNDAGLELIGLPHARCFGRTAEELGLEVLLAAADQSMHSFGTKPTRWLLRKAKFRQDGEPHTLLILADVSLPLKEEEQTAWKRLIRVLGHELSNSLAPIKSIAGSLLVRMNNVSGDADALRDFHRGLGVIESRADSLHRFVQSYRQLAQLPPPLLRSVPLSVLIERVILLEQRLTVRLESGPSINLHADPDQLEQMLINLLANAADASLDNNSTKVCASWRVADTDVYIEIEDSGRGIANVENLFVPFYTTKPTGSGVGLALAQQIARAHGGEIRLANREDAPGVRATIRIPVEPQR